MMRSINKYFFYFLYFSMLLQACIPIEDKIGPQVNDFEIRETYYYQDTINFSVIFTDNSGLDSGSLIIEKLDQFEDQNSNAWFYLDTFNIRGRRIAPDFSIKIPEYKETGDYLITVFGFDEGGNPDTVKRVFTLEADASAPVFKNVSISLDAVNDSLYTACRSEVIRFDGYVTDNLKINQIGFGFSNTRDNTVFFSTDSVNIEDVLQDFVRIPPDTQDSTLITLEILAIDTFQNVGSKKYNILVACDDRPPTFNILKSSPSININNRVKVTQGGSLSINEMFIIENTNLRNVIVYYNKNNEILSELDNIDLRGTTGDVRLNDFIPLNFDIPLTDNPGEIREITFVATDESGNQSELYKVYIDVIPDNPPDLILTNTYINRIDNTFSEVSYIQVQAGDVISFAGKVEELNRLDLLEFYWYDESLLPALVNRFNTFPELPLNLVDYIEDDSFKVPENALSGTNYVLTIRAVDTQGQEDMKRFLFTVF